MFHKIIHIVLCTSYYGNMKNRFIVKTKKYMLCPFSLHEMFAIYKCTRDSIKRPNSYINDVSHSCLYSFL